MFGQNKSTNLKMSGLKLLCRDKDMPITGGKNELLSRLNQHEDKALNECTFVKNSDVPQISVTEDTVSKNWLSKKTGTSKGKLKERKPRTKTEKNKKTENNSDKPGKTNAKKDFDTINQKLDFINDDLKIFYNDVRTFQKEMNKLTTSKAMKLM